MKKKERKGLSVAALVLNVLPLATLIPSICNIALSDRIRFLGRRQYDLCGGRTAFIDHLCLQIE